MAEKLEKTGEEETGHQVGRTATGRDPAMSRDHALALPECSLA